MTLQSIRGNIYFPEADRSAINRQPLFGSLVIDAADEAVCFVFQAPLTGTIDTIGFRTGTVTTGATVDVRLESVSTTTGEPDGLFDTNTNGSQVIDASDDNTWFNTSLTSGASVTKGDLLAVVIVNPSGSPGNIQISVNDSSPYQTIFPYTGLNTGTWTMNQRPPLCSVRYSDTNYYAIPKVYPFSNLSIANIDSDSTPDEVGLYFQVPFKCRVTGFWFFGSFRVGAPTTVRLYDSDGSTVLTSLTVDDDQMYQVSHSPNRYLFDDTQELTINTNYRLTVLPSTSSDIHVDYFETDSAAIMDAFDGGQEVHWTERTDGGGWTETTTRRPFMGLILDQLDDGVGAGAGGVGSLIHGGLVY